MGEDQPPKRKMSKWIKYPLVTLGVLVVFEYMMHMTIGKEFYEKSFSSIDDIIDIARGDMGNFDGSDFDWMRPAPKTISNEYVCETNNYIWREGEPAGLAPYSYCTHFFRIAAEGCAWWRYEQCTSYVVDDFILTDMILMKCILHALREPCVFLPKQSEIEEAKRQNIHVPIALQYAYDEFSCRNGGGPVDHKVVINISNEKREIIARFFHNPPDD